MNDARAQQFAQAWLDAWNRHDLEAILAHYAEEVEFASPFVTQVLGDASGLVRGKRALRDYFARGLAAYPDLHFTQLQVFLGVASLTLQYRSVKNLQAAEVMAFNAAGLVSRVQAHYAPATSAAPAEAANPTTPAAASIQQWQRDDYLLTDDPQQLDLNVVCDLLHSTYWANDRPREVIERGVRHSTCLSLLHRGRQVGLIRGVTDHATFTWVCDVIVDPAHRGRGLGKWMMQCFLAHPALQTISHHLCTKDAHALYESFGFQRIEAMRRSDRPMPFLTLPTKAPI